MRVLTLSIAFFVFAVNTYSQDTIIITPKPRELLFKGNHFGCSIIPLVNRNADVEYVSGPYLLGTKPAGGLEAGFNYHINFSDRYSLVVGLHGGVNVRNYSLFVPKHDFVPAENEDYFIPASLSRTADMYLSAPVLFEYRWRVQKKNFWNLQIGANVRFYPDEIYESWSWNNTDPSGAGYEILNVDLITGNDFKPWVDYNIGGGYTMTLHNWNFFRANLLFNFSNTSIANGDYTIHVPGQVDSHGKYSSQHSYIGLSLSYTWTGTNNRVLKPIRKSLRHRKSL